MEMIYQSTRNAGEQVTASEAILKGLASDGGLFVPNEIPVFPFLLQGWQKWITAKWRLK